MSCYHPNYIVKVKVDSPALRLQYRYMDKMGDSTRNGWKMVKNGNEQFKFFTGYNYDHFKNMPNVPNHEVVQVPCGCCIGCRLDYSRQWANRCYLESLSYKYNYFITLTYDDNNVKLGEYGNATLVPEDLKKFLKDLRAYYKYHYNHNNIRFFACGEYGDTSLRPHYHLIIFNLPIEDLDSNFIYEENGKRYITKHVENGHIYYYSDIIHKIWGKGNILIGDASWQSMAYVSRYVTKKIKGVDSDVYKALGIESEFVRMSRMPGLGEEYFKNHYKEIYENDNLVISRGDKGVSVQPPRYFDKLVDKFQLSDIDLEAIKKYRQDNSEAAQISFDKQSNLSYIDYLETLENTKKHQVSILKRKL